MISVNLHNNYMYVFMKQYMYLRVYCL